MREYSPQLFTHPNATVQTTVGLNLYNIITVHNSLNKQINAIIIIWRSVVHSVYPCLWKSLLLLFMTTLSCRRCKDLIFVRSEPKIFVRREPKLLQKEIAMPSLPHCLGKQYFSTFYWRASHRNAVRQCALQCGSTVGGRWWVTGQLQGINPRLRLSSQPFNIWYFSSPPLHQRHHSLAPTSSQPETCHHLAAPKQWRCLTEIQLNQASPYLVHPCAEKYFFWTLFALFYL